MICQWCLVVFNDLAAERNLTFGDKQQSSSDVFFVRLFSTVSKPIFEWESKQTNNIAIPFLSEGIFWSFEVGDGYFEFQFQYTTVVFIPSAFTL